MRFFLSLIVTAFLITFSTQLMSQDNPAKKEQPEGWSKGAGIGLDFSQLLQINPKQGAGQNRLGLGGAVNFFAKYKKERFAWDNIVNWQFGVVKLGSGLLLTGENIPFQKSIDELRFDSKIGYKTDKTSKFFYAINLSFISQLSPTYAGTADFPGNFLSDITNTGRNPIADLFSPATITLSAGIDYKPTDKLSIFYSPVALKSIIVANDSIADDQAGEAVASVHGNPWRSPTDFDNTFLQFGSLIKIGYAENFLDNRLTYSFNLTLYSNYLQDPQNLDVDWTNEFAISLFKSLQLTATLNIFYDHDVYVQITDFDAPNNIAGLGRRVSITEQILVKYNVIF